MAICSTLARRRRIVGVASKGIVPCGFDRKNQAIEPSDGRIANCRGTFGPAPPDVVGQVRSFWRNGERMGGFSGFWWDFGQERVRRFWAEKLVGKADFLVEMADFASSHQCEKPARRRVFLEWVVEEEYLGSK